MIVYWIAITLVAICVGCASTEPFAIRRHYETHYVMARDNAPPLVGPYQATQVSSFGRVSLRGENGTLDLSLRGVSASGVESIDRQAVDILRTMLMGKEVHLRADCVRVGVTQERAGVPYSPGNRVFTGKDQSGRHAFETLTYVVPQILLITEGLCLVDHSDTEYRSTPYLRSPSVWRGSTGADTGVCRMRRRRSFEFDIVMYHVEVASPAPGLPGVLNAYRLFDQYRDGPEILPPFGKRIANQTEAVPDR